MSFKINEICSILGETQYSVREICKTNGIAVERHLSKSGFTSVFRTQMEEKDFFKQIIDKSNLLSTSDAIIFVNQSLHNQIPGSITEILHDCSLKSNVKFFEMSDACTGFVSSMELANALLLELDIEQVSIILAEKYSKFIDMSDTKVSTLFSDSVTCCTISKSDEIKLISSKASSNFQLRQSFALNNSRIEMQGLSIFDWVTKEVPSHVDLLLDEAKVSRNDVGYWFIHQGSKIVVNTIVEKLKLNPGNYFKAEGYGNLVAGSIPNMIKDFLPLKKKSFKTRYIVLLSFGVGLTMRSMLWELQ
jgi:3-oxoacyl-[acyl-carrier-protein] synthase-3